MANYDLIGNIAIIKFSREDKIKDKKRIAEKILKENKNVSSVLEKVGKFSGRLRVQRTKYVSGVNTKEAVYRENGCEFILDVDKCYFSPRLSNDRLEISKQVKRNENVLVMFGGVGVYAIVIGKNSKCKKVISVELGKIPSKYALNNLKRNRLDNVEIIQGDVRRVIGKNKKINEKFDRIVMARPNLKDSFLDVAFSVSKKGTIIHYHGFYDEDKLDELNSLVSEESVKSKKKIKILGISKAGDIGYKRYRYRMDIKVLN